MSSNLIEYLALNSVVGCAMMVLAFIPLVTDLIAKSGFSSGEVLGGIFAIFFVISTMLLVLNWR